MRCPPVLYRFSDNDQMETCRSATSQTDLATRSSWRLSFSRLSDDDDGYDVIVDDTDDDRSDVIDDSFASRQVNDVTITLD